MSTWDVETPLPLRDSLNAENLAAAGRTENVLDA
jgi:hypothetical protein